MPLKFDINYSVKLGSCVARIRVKKWRFHTNIHLLGKWDYDDTWRDTPYCILSSLSWSELEVLVRRSMEEFIEQFKKMIHKIETKPKNRTEVFSITEGE